MAKAREYRFEQRSGGKGAVMRIGPSGGKRLINVYTDQNLAQSVVDLLNQVKHAEA